MDQRVFFKDGEFLMPLKTGGETQYAEVPEVFISSLISQIEYALDNDYVDYINFSDMGHSHFFIPLNFYHGELSKYSYAKEKAKFFEVLMGEKEVMNFRWMSATSKNASTPETFSPRMTVQEMVNFFSIYKLQRRPQLTIAQSLTATGDLESHSTRLAMAVSHINTMIKSSTLTSVLKMSVTTRRVGKHIKTALHRKFF